MTVGNVTPIAPRAGARAGTRPSAPLYREMRARLLRALADGRYSPGEALPAERELAGEFGISIGTLRKAVDELVSEGILIRRQGLGTFVASHDRDRLLYYFFHLVAHDAGTKTYPTVTLHAFARGRASDEEADKLRVRPEAPVFRLRNRLSLGGAPVMVDDITVDAARFAGLTRARVRDRPSTLYQLYQQAFGQTVVRTSERLRAVAAPAEIAALLELPARAPALMIRRVALSYHGEPIEWRVSHANTNSHEYFSELGG